MQTIDQQKDRTLADLRPSMKVLEIEPGVWVVVDVDHTLIMKWGFGSNEEALYLNLVARDRPAIKKRMAFHRAHTEHGG